MNDLSITHLFVTVVHRGEKWNENNILLWTLWSTSRWFFGKIQYLIQDHTRLLLLLIRLLLQNKIKTCERRFESLFAFFLYIFFYLFWLHKNWWIVRRKENLKRDIYDFGLNCGRRLFKQHTIEFQQYI